jgi:GDP-L-fucose synthase
MAAASVHVMNLEPNVWQAHVQPMCSHLNVGSGHDCSIREVAEQVARVVGFEGAVRFDTAKPDGAPRKLMQSGRLRQLGWMPEIELGDGLRLAYQNFKEAACA